MEENTDMGFFVEDFFIVFLYLPTASLQDGRIAVDTVSVALSVRYNTFLRKWEF